MTWKYARVAVTSSRNQENARIIAYFVLLLEVRLGFLSSWKTGPRGRLQDRPQNQRETTPIGVNLVTKRARKKAFTAYCTIKFNIPLKNEEGVEIAVQKEALRLLKKSECVSE